MRTGGPSYVRQAPIATPALHAPLPNPYREGLQKKFAPIPKRNAPIQLKRLIRKSLGAAGLLLAGLAAGFLILEFGLRLALFGSIHWKQSEYPNILIRAPHPEFGWLLEPDQRIIAEAIEYQVMVNTNDRGLRDLPRAYEKPEGVFRIVVLGDSYVEAAHVEDHDAFHRVLEDVLAPRQVETINLGVGGYATAAAWLYLLAEGFKYDPDLVLLAFYAENDVHGNSPDLSRTFWREDNVRYFGQPYAAWDPETESLEIIPPDYERSMEEFDSRIGDHRSPLKRFEAFRSSLASHLYRQMLQHVRTRIRTPGYDLNIHFGCYLKDFTNAGDGGKLEAAEYQRLFDEAWFLTERMIAEIAAECARRGVDFAFFNAPAQIQFEAHYLEAVSRRYPQLDLDIDLPERRLAEFAGREGIPFFNLLPAFRAADAAGEQVNYRRDSHWNAAGHRLAAETAARELEALGLLPAEPAP